MYVGINDIYKFFFLFIIVYIEGEVKQGHGSWGRLKGR